MREEVNFIVRHKPSVLLFNREDILRAGEANIRGVKNFIVDKKGFNMELFRTLMVKYPYLLNKTE